jgi:hypothetical protein
VESFLRAECGARFFVAKEVSFGKQMALAFGQAHIKGGTGDNQESPLWRAVVINAWNRDVPPPPPPRIDIPFDDPSWEEDFGKAVDSANIALGILDLIADLAEIAALAKFTGPLGLVGSIISTIISMPLIFATEDAYAKVNGEIQGAADAIQDMADQYSDGGKLGPNLSKWPAVKVPSTHVPDTPPPSQPAAAWRAGQTAGLKNAVQTVLNLEEHPKPVTLQGGQHIRVNGRLWLRAISMAYGDNAGVEVVIKPANEELAKKRKPPFPTHP